MTERDEVGSVDIQKQIDACGGIDNFDVNLYVTQFPVGQRCLTPDEYELLDRSETRPEPDDDDPDYLYWHGQMIHKDNGGETDWHLNWNPETGKPVYENGEVPEEVVWAIALLPSPTREAKNARKWRQFHEDQEEMWRSWEQ